MVGLFTHSKGVIPGSHLLTFRGTNLTIALKDVVNVMETVAPASLAEEWDNIGLQVGHYDWPVRKIWVALEATEDLVSEACSAQVSLLITHHPLIFHPIKAVDLASSVGRIIRAAIEHRLAVFCAHTNLDSAVGGVNDVLAEKLGLEKCRVLEPAAGGHGLRKLVVFVPAGYEEGVLNALFESGAGKMHKYTNVSFRTKGVGTFRPEAAARPFQGRAGQRNQADEFRIEALVSPGDLGEVLRNLRRAHPYEEMAYDIYDTELYEETAGMGRIGNLAEATTLTDLAKEIKRKLALDRIKVAGDPGLTVNRAAVCGGSGRGLLENFLLSEAQVYVSGDLGYHDGRRVEAAGKGLVDVGHFASEQLIVEGLATQLKNVFAEKGCSVEVHACEDQKDCFYYL